MKFFLTLFFTGFLFGCGMPAGFVEAQAANPVAPATRATLEGKTTRALRYRPDGTDFVTENGGEFFNRPLYGMNTAFRVDAGDQPEFLLYLPGRGGNLRLGFQTGAGTKWLFDAEKILTRYRPGSMQYEIRDTLLDSGRLELTLLALNATEGLVLRAGLRDTTTPVELVWAYGGANGARGTRDGDIGTEREPVSRFFQLHPEQCRSNVFSIEANTFTLRSKPATLIGLAPSGAKLAVADATQWASLTDLLASSGKPTELPVLVGRAALRTGQPLYLALQRVIQDRDNQEELAVYRAVSSERPGQVRKPRGIELPPAYKVEDLPRVFDEAERHRRALAEQIVVDTPDPFFNAAAAALCVAADGVWDEPQGAFMHGAVAWRSKLLGWRGPYAGDALGWHDRARRHLAYWAGRQNTNPIPAALLSADPTSNLSRNEPTLHSNGDLSNSHYDMNLVYIDALFRHFLWTGDLDFARQVWPVIERHLAWERRLFRRPFGPDQLPLYEAYAAIWASDDLQYHGGGATHATAYNYYHNQMAGRVAKLLGQDATPYEREAELILKAMRRDLWLADRGWFAEWKDLLGLQLTHPNAALWTFYHTLDSEVPTPFEAWQMTRFVDTQIARIPIHGPGVPDGGYYTLPTSSWMPYTWSLNNVVMAEVAHTALAYWQAGRADAAFLLFKGCVLDSMFLGLCPGNVGMCTYFDAYRRESQRDFADGIGVTSRTLVEGLFGVAPDALAGELRIRPGFPADWDRASLSHPDFSVAFRREGLTERFSVELKFPKPMTLRLQTVAQREGIAHVTVNGQPAPWHPVENSVGLPRVEVRCAPAARQEIRITWTGEKLAPANALAVVAQGGEIRGQFGAATLRQAADPQNALSQLTVEDHAFRARATGTLGHRAVFAQVQQGDLAWWQPVTFEIRPGQEILAAENQDASHLRFRVRNNTPSAIDCEAVIRVGERTMKARLQIPAIGESSELTLPSEGLLPGSNRVGVELGNGKTIEGMVINWKIKADHPAAKWDLVNLAPVFNDQVTQIFRNEYLSPRSPFCSLALPKQGIGSWCNFTTSFEVDDAGLRAAAGKAGGLFILPQGVPFQTSSARGEKNIAFTSQWDNYPRAISVPLDGQASHAYLLMAGSSNPMQSRCDNGEVIVTYADGSTDRLALHQPTTWWPIDQDYFLDDFAFRRPEPIPPRVDLKTGMVRVLDVATFKGKGGKVPGGAATVLDLPLKPTMELKSLTLSALANEVVLGVMAVTLAR
jgi:hypothetical protein